VHKQLQFTGALLCSLTAATQGQFAGALLGSLAAAVQVCVLGFGWRAIVIW
jgi:hypothetical protein